MLVMFDSWGYYIEMPDLILLIIMSFLAISIFIIIFKMWKRSKKNEHMDN